MPVVAAVVVVVVVVGVVEVDDTMFDAYLVDFEA